jgi:AcrR family transcriptional regulator
MPVERKPLERLSSLRRQQRQLTVDTLVGAAQRGLFEYGFDVTVDDIAALAEVGRRTVFRHFATREELLEAAMSALTAGYLSSLPPYTGGDWRDWLAELARVSHRELAAFGRLIVDVISRCLPPRLEEQRARDQAALQQMYTTTADTLWKASGGKGPTPQRLRSSVAAHLSPHFTRAVLIDANETPELAAELATEAIAAAVVQLSTESRGANARKTTAGAAGPRRASARRQAGGPKVR